jgi:hypothetical protein
MMGWRLALAAGLAAAAVAGCITYLAAPSLPRVEADQRPRAPASLLIPEAEAPKVIPQHPGAKERDVAAFERAAEAILKRAAYAGASVGAQPITGRIPLPKRRPIPR